MRDAKGHKKSLYLSRWYLTCRTAKDRIILAFLLLFYIVKIIDKRLFYEPEIGFIDKITF
jgi:hypothetical protein